MISKYLTGMRHGLQYAETQSWLRWPVGVGGGAEWVGVGGGAGCVCIYVRVYVE